MCAWGDQLVYNIIIEYLIFSTVEVSLYKKCDFVLNPRSVRWSKILVYAPTTSESLQFLIGLDNIEFLS